MPTLESTAWTQNDTFESLETLQASLNSLQAHHRLRKPASCPADLINFATNDYLGLSQHPRLIEAAQSACTQGVGTGGSRLVTGTLDTHRILEAELAQWMGFPRALVFNSGYQANVGVLSAMINRDDWVFMDKYNHASLIDGCMMAHGQLKRYPHGDFERLEALLKDSLKDGSSKNKGRQRFIVTDTLFSMDGDIAPVYRLLDLAQQYGAWLVLDEAHAVGVYGAQRAGLWEASQLGAHPNVILIGTFSKALGSYGAFVAAHNAVIEHCINQSRSFIYSTSLPAPVMAANLESIRLVQSDPSHTQQLWANIRQFKELMNEAGYPMVITSPIIPIILGGDAVALKAAQSIQSAGYFVKAIRPPTVPEGKSRLRINLSAMHQPNDLIGLVNALKPWLS